MASVTDRVISVRLRIAVAEARRDAKSAADAIRGIGDAAENAGRSTAGLTKLGAAAAGAAKATGAVGAVAAGGIIAMTTAVTKGGIAYNTLEQTSRAALTTLTGSASAANMQMAELREFGKTSPFPRQVWIAAQQQLLAFGMSAEKIIPTFQAIQDAVAAAGGGGQQISEVVDILAKVQSTGQVTAETLNELGYRGIDAATLIGNAMGKTAAEVREDISNQAISGVQFIDMLTGAMESRFGGAAANVKATWVGATDRIKGAIRDIGGLLASPLVDPQGGGAAVDWANSIADALRALEGRLEPAIAALRQRAEPALKAFNQDLQDLAGWIRTADFGAIKDQFQGMLPAITGVSAGLVAMGAHSIPVIGNLVGGLKPLPVALLSAAMASPQLRQALFDLLSAAAPLFDALGQVTSTLASALGPALSVVAALLQPVIAVVQVLANILGALPGPIQMVIAGFIAWKALGLGSWIMENVAGLQRFSQEMKVQQSLAAMGGQEIGTLGAAYSATATKVSGAAMGIRGALGNVANFLTGPWGMAIGVGITLLGAFSSSTEEAEEDQQGLADTLDAATGAITKQTREWVLNKLETGGAADVYRRVGGDINDLIDAYLNVPGASDKVADAMKNGGAAAHINADDLRILHAAIDGASGRMKQARDVAKDKAKVDREGANATNATADASNNASSAANGLSNSLYGVGAATDSVSTRAQQLQGVLAGIFDAQYALESASDGFQGKLQSLRDAFAGNDKAAGKSTTSSNAYGDALRRQQKIIKDTSKQLEDLAEAQRKAEEEAAEAARAARQRQLDELFGKQFDVQATVDQFRSALAQASKDMKDNSAVAGSRDLLGFTEGALSNRDRMRSIVQAAQAAIQAERDQGASGARLNQVSGGLASQLEEQAAAWGLNADQVKQYSDAIRGFGSLASQQVVVDLSEVQQQYADQRKEIQENSAEQMENARQSAASAAASQAAAGATKYHTATLEGNSESAIKNRGMMRDLVKGAQDELTQLHLSGAGRDEVRAKGQELIDQLEAEAIQLGFTKEDVAGYTGTIHASAEEIARYPVLNARANVDAAMTTVTNFVNGVNREMARIQKNLDIGVHTGTEFINTMSGGHMFFADGGFVSGPGGPRDDKIPAMLSNREFVVNAQDTARHRSLLEYINSGTEIDWMPRRFAGGGYVDPVNLTYQGLYDPAQTEDTFKKFGSLFGPLSVQPSTPTPAGSGVQRWAPVTAEVLAMLGQPAGLLPKVLRRMNQESGGNPTVVNKWDSNWQKGTPSVGLMQVIGPTFRRWAGPFVGTGPQLYGVSVDPRANIFAGLNYAQNRYPSLQYAMDKPGGYRDGGLVSRDVLGSYAAGTDYVPMDGLYELHKGEAVVPAQQNAGGPLVLEVRGDGSKASDFVIDAINKGVNTGQIRLVMK